MLEVILGSLQIPQGPLQQPTVVPAPAFQEGIALPPERCQHQPVALERFPGATKKLEDEGTVHLERGGIGAAEPASSQIRLVEGLPEVPPEGERHTEAHPSLGRLFDQRGAFRRRNGGAEQADRPLDISELARGQCESPLRRRDPGRVRRGLRVHETGGRHLARPMGVRLDESQRFGDVRGILATAHAHLPVAPTGAK